MTYCTLADARLAGAVGDDASVTRAITDAQSRVDAFTGDLFEPQTRTVVARLGGDGRALLPYRLTTVAGVTAVLDHDTDTPYPSGSYRATTSAVDGDVDAIGVGRNWVPSNILILGLEPWAEGGRYQGRLRVTAQFGWSAVPEQVKNATAHLAALLSKQIVPDNDANPATPVPAPASLVDAEGNVIPVVPGFNGSDEEVDIQNVRTTGSRTADALLVPFRRINTLTAV